MKKQIWLRPDQVSLVVGALELVKSDLLHSNPLANTAQVFACSYTALQINDVLAMLKK